MDHRTLSGAHLPEDGGDAPGSAPPALGKPATRRWVVATVDGPRGRRVKHHAPTLDAAMVRAAIILGRGDNGDGAGSDVVVEPIPPGKARTTATTPRQARRISYPKND